MPFRLGAEADVAALIRVFCGVVEEVRHHLGEPHGIGLQLDRLFWKRNRQLMFAGFDHRAGHLNRAPEDRGQFHPFLAELDLAA